MGISKRGDQHLRTLLFFIELSFSPRGIINEKFQLQSVQFSGSWSVKTIR